MVSTTEKSGLISKTNGKRRIFLSASSGKTKALIGLSRKTKVRTVIPLLTQSFKTRQTSSGSRVCSPFKIWRQVQWRNCGQAGTGLIKRRWDSRWYWTEPIKEKCSLSVSSVRQNSKSTGTNGSGSIWFNAIGTIQTPDTKDTPCAPNEKMTKKQWNSKIDWRNASKAERMKLGEWSRGETCEWNHFQTGKESWSTPTLLGAQQQPNHRSRNWESLPALTETLAALTLIAGLATLRQIANDHPCSKLYVPNSAPFAEFWFSKVCHRPFLISEQTCTLSSGNNDRAMFRSPKSACRTAALPPAPVLVSVTKTELTGKRFTWVDLRRNSRFFSLRSMWDRIITLSNCPQLWAVCW